MTVQTQMKDFQERFTLWQQSCVSHVPAPPALPLGSPLKTPTTPKPPKTPAPTKQRTRQGTTLRPARPQVTRSSETREPAPAVQSEEALEELPPLSHPGEKASLCLEQLRSKDL